MKKLLYLVILAGCNGSTQQEPLIQVRVAEMSKLSYQVGCLDYMRVMIQNGNITTEPKSVARKKQIEMCYHMSEDYAKRVFK